MRRLVSGPRKLDFEFLLPAKDAATLVELSGTAPLNSSAHITNHVTRSSIAGSRSTKMKTMWFLLSKVCAERTAKAALPPQCSGSQGSLDRSQKAPLSQEGQQKATKGRHQTLQAREATRGSSREVRVPGAREGWALCAQNGGTGG